VKIFYEVNAPDGKIIDTILLIGRNAESLLFWPNKLVDFFVSKGYKVIRFDNRGLGLSDWMPKWNKNNAYSLENMARDAIAVIDCLKIDKFHLVVVSMRGMIAQRVAIDFPSLVKTMTSIMSSAFYFDRTLVSLSNNINFRFIKIKLAFWKKPLSIERLLKMRLAINQLWRGSGPYANRIDDEINSLIYEIKIRNGFNKDALKQHVTAIKKSRSRLDELHKILCPTLITQGK